MHPHIRTATAVALLALTVAACGSSATTASPSASAAAEASSAPSLAPSAPVAPDASAAASPPSSPDASAGTAASASPAATPTSEQQALMDRLPKQIGTVMLSARMVDGAGFIASDPQGNKGLVDFLTTIGLTPDDLIIAFSVPTSRTGIPFSVGAYRFVGADAAKLRTEFVKANLDSQPGSTAKDETVGGRKVVALGAPAGDQGPPVYLLFEGDTVFVVSSTDEGFAAEAVKALPVK